MNPKRASSRKPTISWDVIDQIVDLTQNSTHAGLSVVEEGALAPVSKSGEEFSTDVPQPMAFEHVFD